MPFLKGMNVGGNRVLTFFREIRAMIQPEKWFELIHIYHSFFLFVYFGFNHHFKEMLLVSNHRIESQKNPSFYRQGCKVSINQSVVELAIHTWKLPNFCGEGKRVPESENGPGGFCWVGRCFLFLLLPYSEEKTSWKNEHIPIRRRHFSRWCSFFSGGIY